MTMRFAGWILLFSFMFFPSSAVPAGPGEGWGESMLAMASPRQSGSGGVALEDPWRQGGLLEAYTVLLEPGLRWIGVGGQAG